MTASPEPVHETAASTDRAALTFGGVDHVSLTVTDLNVSARFYTEVLGFTVVLDFGYGLACIHKTTGFTLSLIRHPDGIALEFYAPTDRFAAALGELRSRIFSDEELLDAAEQLGLGAYVARRIS